MTASIRSSAARCCSPVSSPRCGFVAADLPRRLAVVVALPRAFASTLDIAARAGVHGVDAALAPRRVALACVAVAIPALPVEAVLSGTTLGLVGARAVGVS